MGLTQTCELYGDRLLFGFLLGMDHHSLRNRRFSNSVPWSIVFFGGLSLVFPRKKQADCVDPGAQAVRPSFFVFGIAVLRETKHHQGEQHQGSEFHRDLRFHLLSQFPALFGYLKTSKSLVSIVL